MTGPNVLSNRQQQLGAFSILTASTLLMLLMFLVLVLDSGRLYMEQRKLQKVADTAALGALLLLPDGNCSTNLTLTRENAEGNAKANDFDLAGSRQLTLQCADIEQIDGLSVAIPNNSSGRAVEVTVSNEVPSSLILQVGKVFNSNLPEKIVLQATAVAARDEPVAVFSVGSQLLRLNNSKLLGSLLTTVGLKPDTITVLDEIGLANATITPSGLLSALEVDIGLDRLKALSPEGLIDLNTKIGALGINRLIDASIQLIDDKAIDANLQLLKQRLLPEAPILENLELKLFSTPGSPGILSLSTDSGDSALDAKLNLGEILTTSILIGSQGRALSIGADGTPGLDLLGKTISIEAGIVEPPSIGVGPKGTEAYNAQIRLKIDIKSAGMPLIGSLLELLGTSIELPIIIDLVSATGELIDASCDGIDTSATIHVVSRLGSACIGNMSNDTMWSTSEFCADPDLELESLTMVKLLGMDLLYGNVKLPIGETYPEKLTFSQKEEDLQECHEFSEENFHGLPCTKSSKFTNPMRLGTLLDNLSDEVLKLLENSPDIPEQLTEAQATTIANRYLNLSELSPENTNFYTVNEIIKIEEKIHNDNLDWHRPAGLLDTFSQDMTKEWRRKMTIHANCRDGVLSNRYEAACVKNQLISSLQSKAADGWLSGSVKWVVGDIAQPLLATILDPIVELLEGILNIVGEYLISPIVSDLLGIELSRTDVTVHSIGCGAPRLIR